MVSYSTTWNDYISNLHCHAHIHCSQAWMRDEDDDAGAAGSQVMQKALIMKRHPTNTDVYIKFLTYYGPALTGTSFWNNNKTTKSVHELLTISDEAFIHLCIVNYSATWKAQEQSKTGLWTVEVPVSTVYFI